MPPTVSRRPVRLPSRVACVCLGALALLGVVYLGAELGRGSHAPAGCRHCTRRRWPRLYREQSLSEAPKHPHVVVIVLDDVGYGDMKPWAKDNTVVLTPNIDRLASGGMVLDRHYSQVRCSPSRAALLTGRYPIRYGLQSQVLSPVKPYGLPTNETTMAQILKTAGYATHMVGKWHLGFHAWSATPTFRGFDTWFGLSSGADHYDQTLSVGKAGHLNGLFWQAQPNCGAGCATEVERNRFSSNLWTDEAVRIVEEHNHSVPLFLYLCYTASHAPCQAPPEPYADLYPNVEDPKRKVYAEMLSAVDGGIGNVTAALSKKDMLQDTILVVLSDNGGPVGFPGQAVSKADHCQPFGKWGADTGASNYPFRGGKGAAFEGGTHTPALLHYPRQIRGGRRFAGLAHLTDWLPTILAAASVKDNGSDRPAFPLDGVSLWPALLENGPSPRREVLLDIDANGVGTGGALIRNFTKLFVGHVFNETNFWALPPEVALARNVTAKDVPIFAPAMSCSQGCVFDLETDPREQHPRDATAEDKDLMDAYMVYQRAMVPSLFYTTANDKKAIQVYNRLHSIWPYESEGNDTQSAPITS